MYKSITSRGVQLISELESNHEEADTKMLFHINLISQNNFQSVLIISPDTDVALLCMYYYNLIGIDIYFRTGSGNKGRILRIRDLVNNLEMRTSVITKVFKICRSILWIRNWLVVYRWVIHSLRKICCLDLISCSCRKECLSGSCCGGIDNMLPCTNYVCYRMQQFTAIQYI